VIEVSGSDPGEVHSFGAAHQLWLRARTSGSEASSGNPHDLASAHAAALHARIMPAVALSAP
jgi:hypothetical protein